MVPTETCIKCDTLRSLTNNWKHQLSSNLVSRNPLRKPVRKPSGDFCLRDANKRSTTKNPSGCKHATASCPLPLIQSHQAVIGDAIRIGGTPLYHSSRKRIPFPCDLFLIHTILKNCRAEKLKHSPVSPRLRNPLSPSLPPALDSNGGYWREEKSRKH